MKVRPVELASILKAILRIRRVDHTAMGLVFHVDPVSNFGNRIISEGEYEPEITRVVLELLRPGEVFLDVGANEGWYSVVAGRAVGCGGAVFALEPQERLWPSLIRNFATNGLLNAFVVPYAAASKRGTATISLYPSINSGATTLVTEKRRALHPTQEIATKTLDEIAHDYRMGEIRLAKLDVEGYELEVLKGATGLLASQRIAHLLIELHPTQLRARGETEQMVEDLLANAGYKKASRSGVNLWSAPIKRG